MKIFCKTNSLIGAPSGMKAIIDLNFNFLKSLR